MVNILWIRRACGPGVKCIPISDCDRRVKLVLKCTGEAFLRNYIHEYTFVKIEAGQPYQWPFKVGVHKKDKPGRIHFLTKARFKLFFSMKEAGQSLTVKL